MERLSRGRPGYTPDVGIDDEYDPEFDVEGWVDSDVVTQMRDRLIEQQALHAVPQFTEATFLASLRSARMNTHGELDITLTVPIAEKYRAMSLTDAIGIEVVVTAQRKRGLRLTRPQEAEDG